MLAAAFSEISHFYNIPLAMGSFATGAKEAGWQAAVDNCFAALIPVLGKAAMLNGAGTLNGSKIFSLQELIMKKELPDSKSREQIERRCIHEYAGAIR